MRSEKRAIATETDDIRRDNRITEKDREQKHENTIPAISGNSIFNIGLFLKNGSTTPFYFQNSLYAITVYITTCVKLR